MSKTWVGLASNAIILNLRPGLLQVTGYPAPWEDYLVRGVCIIEVALITHSIASKVNLSLVKTDRP